MPCRPQVQVLVDTAGCNPYDAGELRELKMLASLKGIEAGAGASPPGAIVRRAIDMVTAFFGSPAQTAAHHPCRYGTPFQRRACWLLRPLMGFLFCNVSMSSSIADTLQPVDGTLLAQLLLRYKSKTG